MSYSQKRDSAPRSPQKLVAVDLDGTLVGPNGVERVIIPILRNLHLKSIFLCVVTGRPLEDCLAILSENNLGIRYNYPQGLITEEREIYLLRDKGYVPFKKWNTRVTKIERDILPMASDFLAQCENLLRIKGYTPKRCPNEEKKRGFVGVIFPNLEEAKNAERSIAILLKDTFLPLKVVRNERGVGLRHHDTGKGITLRKLCEFLDIPSKSVLAIGNSTNDEDMLDGRFNFFPAAPANAEEQVKKTVLRAGGYVSKASYTSGVADIIESLLFTSDFHSK